MNRQKGFGAIAAIVLLVIMAAMAGAIVSFSSTQQQTSAQDVLSAKAWMAARAGTEYGLYRALQGDWSSCSGASEPLNLTADMGLWVTVSCDSQVFNEGQEDCPSGSSDPSCTGGGTTKNRSLRVYDIRAVACSVSSCPGTGAVVSGPFYVERTRQVVATNQ